MDQNILMPEPCPLLPVPERAITAQDSKALGKERGEPFYSLCLEYAQTKWLADLPAQALLQLNRAMSADLKGNEDILSRYPVPYRAIVWMLEARPDKRGIFFGNPRRHWQHYATRMGGPRSEVRKWRAWACWALSVRILPEEEFPADVEQIEEEGLVLPEEAEIRAQLTQLGWEGEADLWSQTMSETEFG